MMDIGGKTKQVEKVSLHILMDQYMMVNGGMISNMVMVKKSGKMDLSMTDSIIKVINMERVIIYGKMDQIIMVIGNITKSMEKVSILGRMAKYTMDNGKIIIWKE